MRVSTRLAFLLAVVLITFEARPAKWDFDWVRAIGSYNGLDIDAIALDSAGNVYSTGYFEETMDFDPEGAGYELTSEGDDDVFVQKSDAAGNIAWIVRMGGDYRDRGDYIAVDGEGAVYITGNYLGLVDSDPGEGVLELPFANTRGTFIQKLDTNGSLLWGRGLVGDYVTPDGIALDGEGNVYVCGDFSGTVDLDPGAGEYPITSQGRSDAFALKLNVDGDFVWARAFGGSELDYVFGMTADAQGNVYTTGRFSGTADFDPGAESYFQTSTSGATAYIQKLDTEGRFVWARQMGGVENSTGIGVVVDRIGSVHTAGTFVGTVDFDPGEGAFELVSAGGSDLFVQKMDSNGQFVWATSLGGSNYDNFGAITLDATGHVYLTGGVYETVDFDPGEGVYTYTARGTTDVFVQVLDRDGKLSSVTVFGGNGGEGSTGIALGATGAIHLTGGCSVSTDFDPGPGVVRYLGERFVTDYVLKLEVAEDTTPPSALSIVPSTEGPTNADAVSFSVTFDEDVRNFSDASDLMIEHEGTVHESISIEGGFSRYNVTVSGISGDGSFTVAVNTASDVQDLTGNTLASSVVSAAVAIDNTPPGFKNIASIPVEVVAGNPVLLTFDSTETLSDDPEVTVNGKPATLSRKAAYGYTYITLESDATGPAAIEIRGMDIAGNPGVTIDTTALSIIEAIPEGEGALEGGTEGVIEGGVEGGIEGAGEGMPEGAAEGAMEGAEEGVIEGSLEGQNEGEEEGTTEGSVEGGDEGEGEGTSEGAVEGEGEVEGAMEGAAEGEGEGMIEGESEGAIEGEGEDGPRIRFNAFNGGGLLSCRCNAFGPAPSLEEILGQLFMGALTVMALVLMAAYQRRFW
ncbi:MAG: hypothetical protein RLZZ303_1810 [Candidatus Hydrogenedentota bacterium]